MLVSRPTCPSCGSQHTVKNGKIHNQKPKYQCQNCKIQFVENPTNKVITKDIIELIDRLLLEKIPLAGIARATLVSETWLQKYVNNKYDDIPQQVNFSAKPRGKLTIECDEAWSFVSHKANKQWIWLALDKKTREIVGVYIGDRSEDGARGLWNSLPPVSRQCAVCYTDFWAVYAQVIPSKRHQAVGNNCGKINHIERFNNIMRQRISRLVRKTLSFSKKLDNHIGAIWYFIHHYNSCCSA
ncbi:IS1 family transposase [Nostoc punctiforme UO1]|uniref:IS1 family transposase n=1 Tax=Nostoc punctiforme TaxID=272131 RepID=UPI0030AC67BB